MLSAQAPVNGLVCRRSSPQCTALLVNLASSVTLLCPYTDPKRIGTMSRRQKKKKNIIKQQLEETVKDQVPLRIEKPTTKQTNKVTLGLWWGALDQGI